MPEEDEESKRRWKEGERKDAFRCLFLRPCFSPLRFRAGTGAWADSPPAHALRGISPPTDTPHGALHACFAAFGVAVWIATAAVTARAVSVITVRRSFVGGPRNIPGEVRDIMNVAPADVGTLYI